MMTDLDLVQGILDLGAFGILGFMLLWFMRRNDSHMKRSTEAMNLMAQAIFRWLERTDHEEARRLSKELDRVNGDGDD